MSLACLVETAIGQEDWGTDAFVMLQLRFDLQAGARGVIKRGRGALGRINRAMRIARCNVDGRVPDASRIDSTGAGAGKDRANQHTPQDAGNTR